MQPEPPDPPRPQYGGTDTGLKTVVGEERKSVIVPSEADTGEDEAWHPNHHTFFIRHIIYTVLLTAFPWIFFGVVSRRGGVQFHGRAATNIYEHPKATIFVVTTIATVVTFCINYLFTTAVTSLAQKWVVHRGFDVFHIAFFTALRTHMFLWHKRGWSEINRPGRRLLVPMVALFIVTFTFVASGMTALLTPTIFPQTTSLEGTEIDFASRNPDCTSWFESTVLPADCDWKPYRGSFYTTCPAENQLTDVLESGRANIVSLITNNTASFTYPQLDGMRFLGPMRGVLPIGQNGISAFNTIAPSGLSKRRVPAGLSYNYTLDLQGLSSTVSCNYDTQSPIEVILDVTTNFTLAYRGTCPDGQQEIIFGSSPFLISRASNNTLSFFACRKPPSSDKPDESYVLYFRGWSQESVRGSGFYSDSIGNITCSLSPVNSAVFPTTYRGRPGVFIAGNATATTAVTRILTNITTISVEALASIVWEAQNAQANLVAESVFTYGVKSFGLPKDKQGSTYLRLYEAMIQGMIEYEATYSRLRYSMQAVPPSCLRSINGSAEYELFGWSAKRDTAGFLIPMTLINLASLVILVYAMSISDHGPKLLPRFDPLDPEQLILESERQRRDSYLDPAQTEAWNAKVVYAKDESGKYVVQFKTPGSV